MNPLCSLAGCSARCGSTGVWATHADAGRKGARTGFERGVQWLYERMQYRVIRDRVKAGERSRFR